MHNDCLYKLREEKPDKTEQEGCAPQYTQYYDRRCMGQRQFDACARDLGVCNAFHATFGDRPTLEAITDVINIYKN